MEKSVATTTVSDVSSEEASDIAPISVWSPGYWTRFPFAGAIALACIVALACTALGVLIGSDGVSTSSWPQRIAPNVVLSAINALSSLSLAIAVGEGVAIAWWRHAMKGSTVQELHHQWELSSGIWALITRPKSLFTSSIALAVLGMQVTVLNSILYQRATSTYTGPDPARVLTTVGIAAQEFPTTGYVVSNTSAVAGQTSCECFMIGDRFTPIVNNWQTANGFFSGYNELFRFSKEKTYDNSESLDYCNGICMGSLEAIGFEIDCAESQNHSNIALPAIAAYQAKGDPSEWSNLAIFNSSFALEYTTEERNYSQIAINLQYFQSDDPYNPNPSSCPGTVFKKQCTLRPAIISYPIKVTNFTNEHIVNGVELLSTDVLSVDASLNSEVSPPKYNSQTKQAEGFSVVRYLYTQDTHAIRSLTQLGGIANAFGQVLSSSAAITYTGVDNSWSLSLMGTLAGRMMFGPPNMGSCDCSFRGDTLDIMIASINQLSFLTATGMIDTTPFRGLPRKNHPFPSTLPQAPILAVDQNYTTTFAPSSNQASELTDVVHYKTHYLFAGLAFAITILCVVLVIPSFWHYGELGRRVTLGPVEIASAFGAPILVDDTAAKDGVEKGENIDSLIKHIGDRKIVYGFVDVDEGGRQEMQLDSSNEEVQPTTQPPALTSPMSPTAAIDSPMASPQLERRPTSTLQKRRSVRLAMGAPERVRPTSEIYPLQSPRLGNVKE